MRSELIERYRALPLPTTSEESWRFTDLEGFDPEAFTASGDATAAAPSSLLDIDVAGVVHVTENELVIDRAPDGIAFAPLDENHERLYELVGYEEKFAAHNAAMWKNGLLVHVPRGVVLEQPLYVRIANSVAGGSLFWRLLVVAEEGSRFSLIEEYVSSSTDLPSYTNAAVELYVEQAAKLEYVSIQNLSQETWHFASHHARVARDAELDWVAGGFGSKRGKVRIQNDLRGMIRVEKDAQKTNAYQENRNLLLSEQAHADSIPGLEILANDVRCTHGATVGQVDREQLFYLMARGLSRGEAERLIVRGFFSEILDRIELEPVREALGEALEARIPQA
jgi:Fe-S cluster assembly protein SufD